MVLNINVFYTTLFEISQMRCNNHKYFPLKNINTSVIVRTGKPVSAPDGSFFSNGVIAWIHYLIELFRHVPLRVLNINCSLLIFHLIQLHV